MLRSCTDVIEINLFMVDHVCMSEGGGKGKMCFCEEHECNRGSSSKTFSMVTAAVQLLLLISYLSMQQMVFLFFYSLFLSLMISSFYTTNCILLSLLHYRMSAN